MLYTALLVLGFLQPYNHSIVPIVTYVYSYMSERSLGYECGGHVVKAKSFTPIKSFSLINAFHFIHYLYIRDYKRNLLS